MANGALDNDILFKGACYLLLRKIAASTGSKVDQCGVLGAAKFVVGAALRKRRLGDALSHFLELVENFESLEPTQAELSAAAEIELDAQRRGLELDAGESLLFAIVDVRCQSFLMTGDKRAIAALEFIVVQRGISENWGGRVVCMEQAIRRVVAKTDPFVVRERICTAPDADRALAICFNCLGGTSQVASWLEGLDSYVAGVRATAPTILSVD